MILLWWEGEKVLEFCQETDKSSDIYGSPQFRKSWQILCVIICHPQLLSFGFVSEGPGFIGSHLVGLQTTTRSCRVIEEKKTTQSSYFKDYLLDRDQFFFFSPQIYLRYSSASQVIGNNYCLTSCNYIFVLGGRIFHNGTEEANVIFLSGWCLFGFLHIYCLVSWMHPQMVSTETQNFIEDFRKRDWMFPRCVSLFSYCYLIFLSFWYPTVWFGSVCFLCLCWK